MKKRLVVVSLMALLVSGIFGPARAIIQGQPDGNRHPYVGMIFNDETFCSGSLIAPQVFLTAGHCTEEFRQPSGGQTWVTFQEDASAFPEDHLVTAVYTHPDYCLGCGQGLPGFATFDVGIAILAEPVQLSEYGLLPSPNVVESLSAGTRVTAVGYGIRDRLKNLDPDEFAKRYFARTKIIETNSRVSDIAIKVQDNPAHGGTCFGDSGGPFLLRNTNTILGVNSFGTNINCAGAGYAARIDIPVVLDWIKSFL